MFLLVAFMPTHPDNCTVREVKAWLPIMMQLWKENWFNNYCMELFSRLLQDIVCNFKDIDVSEFDEFLFYRSVQILEQETFNDAPVIKCILIEKWLAKYYVNRYKPISSGSKESKFGIRMLLNRFLPNLHPENTNENKDSLAYFIKFISSAL